LGGSSEYASTFANPPGIGANPPILAKNSTIPLPNHLQLTVMNTLNDTLSKLELAQIGWVVPDINASMQFLSKTLGIEGFPQPEHFQAQDLQMDYHGKLVPGDWLTTQTYNGGTFIELIQPLTGQSMFHDYLQNHPNGGVQHLAFRLPVDGLDRVVEDILTLGYKIISEVNHPIAKMVFFDTDKTLGTVTEIMGITEDGWKIIAAMENK